LPCLQQPSTCSYPKPDKSSQCPTILYATSSKCRFSSDFPIKNSLRISLPSTHATCLAYPFFLYLTTLIISDEEFKSYRFSLCTFSRIYSYFLNLRSENPSLRGRNRRMDEVACMSFALNVQNIRVLFVAKFCIECKLLPALITLQHAATVLS
jgi:hypothetical protein